MHVYHLDAALSHLCLVIPHHLLQTHTHRPLRLPTKTLLRPCRIRPPLLWIIRRDRLVHNLHALRSLDPILILHLFDDITHELGKLTNGKLVTIADINRPRLVRVHERNETIDKIMYVLKGPGLLAVSVDSHVFAFEGLDDEVGDDTSIVWVHWMT